MGELSAGLRINVGDSYNILSGNYAYVNSVEKSYWEEGTEGKTLPYNPRNRWNAGYSFGYKDIAWFHYNISYTDARFTSADESYQTEAYTLHNLEAGYKLKLKGNMALDLSLKVDNIFNAYHESTQYYPMPLRMFWGRVVYLF